MTALPKSEAASVSTCRIIDGFLLIICVFNLSRFQTCKSAKSTDLDSLLTNHMMHL